MPCTKCDIDSHGNFMSQIVGSLVQIHTQFHDDSLSFIQVLFIFHAKTWHGFWTSSSDGIYMAFAKKMMGYPSDLVSFSNQTKLPSKRHEKIPVTFFTGRILKKFSSQHDDEWWLLKKEWWTPFDNGKGKSANFILNDGSSKF